MAVGLGSRVGELDHLALPASPRGPTGPIASPGPRDRDDHHCHQGGHEDPEDHDEGGIGRQEENRGIHHDRGYGRRANLGSEGQDSGLTRKIEQSKVLVS